MKAFLRELWTLFMIGAALGALSIIYRESHAFRDELSWPNWLILGFVIITFVAAAESLIANGVAKGIAKASTEEPNWKEKRASFNQSFKEYRDSKQQGKAAAVGTDPK